MDRSQLLDIDYSPALEVPSTPAADSGVRNIEKVNQHLTDAQVGAIPKTTAEVTSAKALLAPAGLDWQVGTEKIFARRITGELLEVPARKAIVRLDTNTVIGDVGENYGVVQNDQLAELADAVRGIDGSWTWAQGGALRGGSRVFLQLKAPVRKVGHEGLQSNISLFNSFDGSLKFSAGFSDVVIVCVNTFRAARLDAQNGILLRHTSGISARVKTATQLIEAARKYTDAVDNGILSLMNRKITYSKVEALAQKLVPGDSKKAENVRESLLAAYLKAPGAQPGTAWGAFQAVTYHATHEVGVRKTSGRTEEEARVESSWWGTGAELTQNAWDVLTDEEQVQKLVYVKVSRA
jgi:phage/plasmid-like protein (TIGR03299 family)